MANESNNGKRRFSILRNLILQNLSQGQKTINQIASETGINWKTVDNHLTYLVGKGLAKEVFSSSYVRIFEITQKGADVLQQNPEKQRFRQHGEVKIA